MYSIRRNSYNSYDTPQYSTMNYKQAPGHNRRLIKTKQLCSSSTKSYNNHGYYYECQTLNNNSTSNKHDLSLPIYRAPCTFRNSLIRTSKDGCSCAIFHRSRISSCSSSCVPDVYSPGFTSKNNCSPPPPSSNLPPPPSEWLN